MDQKPETTMAEAQRAVNEWFPFPDKRYEDAKSMTDYIAAERELED